MSESFENRGVQQDDNYREFMGWITGGGLRYAYAKKNGNPSADDLYRKQVDKDDAKKIIIVGAGMSGLTAAYELAQIGHEVIILELQSRVGGRVKTLREGFSDGLHCEAGAMRIPYNHFLTKHYIDLFKLKSSTFQDYNENAFMYLYGEKITMKEWTEKNGHYCNKFWKGWDANLTKKLKVEMKIDGILDYYNRTMDQVKEELGESPSEDQWQKWIDKWSKLSVEDFLRSSNYQKEGSPKLRPWPEAAIDAYKVSTYTPFFSMDLVSYLREEIGEWYKDPLYTIASGMDCLPKAFVKKNDKGWNKDVDLSKNIIFGFMVQKVKNFKDGNGNEKVKVFGMNRISGQEEVFIGNAVILTIPLQMMRHIEMPLNLKQKKAIASISHGAATKIMLQCKTRFWQKEVGQGGFSKTNMQIGQLHYPDYEGSGISGDERGVLMVYTWDENALTFGAETKNFAITNAINQVSKIHPDIKREFEVGDVQAWYSDPTAQGAYVSLKPYEYLDYMKALTKPSKTIFLAGEALSWSNGWIQGAVFSGLMQAYFFQSLMEGNATICDHLSFFLNKVD
ncbi:putative L-amino-acid oxidase YobN [Mercenaria mercenaria]|uniref:putative L-amino-acid oxidase YobN n=1 Tax=Mercenaria mercenaria TaxID=6596 RepID=UPI00234E52DB|nr:putative L-amino-acid oxidase YobN [Mercenaria mercenaria]